MNKTLNQTLPAGRRQNWNPQTIQPAVVSQAELRQIFDFQRQQGEIDELVELVQRKMELGASIESGPMKVETVAQSVEAIDKTTLTCFFGRDKVNSLVRAISSPPTTLRVVGEIDLLFPHSAPQG